MKKNRILLLLLVLLFIFTACGEKINTNETSIVIKKKNSIISAIIEDFDKDYYSEDEMKEYINKKIDDYNSSAGSKRISIDTYDIKDGKAKVYLKFSSMRDYAEFNDVDFFNGSITEALIAGYDFDVEFKTVEDGKITGTESADNIVEMRDYNVAIVSEALPVFVPGTILYVSDGNVKVTGEKSVKVGFSKEAFEEESSEEISSEEISTEEVSTIDISTEEKPVSKLAYIVYK